MGAKARVPSVFASKLARTLASVGLLALNHQAIAHSGNGDGEGGNRQDLTSCAGLLASGSTTFIPSPHQTAEGRAKIREAIEIIFGPNGLAAQLGLAIPPHIIEMMPSELLFALATLGRHPAGHWVDGKAIVREGDREGSRGIMEFATPGCPTCRSYYRDTTDYWEQIEILFHVAGHNDFSEHSVYARARDSDVMEHSRRFADMVAHAYVQVGKAEVAEFVQHLYATAHLQDFVQGTFEAPGSTRAHTPSVLQGLEQLLHPGTPSWKRELLVQFEKTHRYFPYISQTKIMNEGWATFLMEVLLRHSPWANTAQGFRHGGLMQGVLGSRKVPWLENPYWLGREAWERIYARFLARPETQKLGTALERDRAFIHYAHAQFISTLNDTQFLNAALDEVWVARHNLFIPRLLTDEEEDPNLPPPPPGRFKKPVQMTVATRDPNLILASIIEAVADRGKKMPRLRIARDSKPGDLVLEQDPSWGVPLAMRSVGATLYALHKVVGGSVRLHALVRDILPVDKTIDAPQVGWIDAYVSKGGTPHVYRNSSGLSSDTISKYQRVLEKSRTRYAKQSRRLYVELPRQATLNREEAQELGQTHVLRLEYLLRTKTDQAPTVAQALEEYQLMLQFSQNSAVHALFNEDSESDAISVSSSGVSIGVLPEIPEFELERGVEGAIVRGNAPSLTVGQIQLSSATDLSLRGSVTPGPYAPNEKFYGEGENSGEGGEGEGNSDEESPDGKDPATGKRPGRTGKDPQKTHFPLEEWGKLLQKYLELPNLRRTHGLSEVTETQREGGAHHPSGQILWSRTAMDALAWGRIILSKKGLLKPSTSLQEMMQEGWKHLPQSQYTVADRDTVPQPDMNAVVVFVVDKSGSMDGDPIRIAKNAVYNILALLKASYPQVEARFVGFDETATESSAEDFFSSTKGGGTRYTSGIELTQTILKRFPKEKWNRYVYFFGDGDDSNEEATRDGMRALAAETEFMGFGLVDPTARNISSGLSLATQNLARQMPRFGWAHITKSAQSMFRALRAFFGKDPKQP